MKGVGQRDRGGRRSKEQGKVSGSTIPVPNGFKSWLIKRNLLTKNFTTVTSEDLARNCVKQVLFHNERCICCNENRSL